MKMQSRLKRTAPLLTAFMMAMSSMALTACSDSGNTTEEETTTGQSEELAAENTDDSLYVNPDWSYGQVAIGGG